MNRPPLQRPLTKALLERPPPPPPPSQGPAPPLSSWAVYSLLGLLLAATLYYILSAEQSQPYCLTRRQYIECRACPKHAVCLTEEQFVCKRGFIRVEQRCERDPGLQQEGKELAQWAAEQMHAGCFNNLTLLQLARALHEHGGSQIQIEKAIKTLRTDSFLKLNGLTREARRIYSAKPAAEGRSCSQGARHARTLLLVALPLAMLLFVLRWGK